MWLKKKKPENVLVPVSTTDGAETEVPPVKVLIEERVSELERITKILQKSVEENRKGFEENKKGRQTDRGENRKWRWITIGLAVFAILLSGASILLQLKVI